MNCNKLLLYATIGLKTCIEKNKVMMELDEEFNKHMLTILPKLENDLLDIQMAQARLDNNVETISVLNLLLEEDLLKKEEKIKAILSKLANENPNVEFGNNKTTYQEVLDNENFIKQVLLEFDNYDTTLESPIDIVQSIVVDLFDK